MRDNVKSVVPAVRLCNRASILSNPLTNCFQPNSLPRGCQQMAIHPFFQENIPSMTITLYHNPRCSKSRQALELLREHGTEPNVIEYLRTPPSREQLKDILQLLGIGPRALLRRGEEEYAALNLDNPALSDDAVIDAMVSHPKLIERPIFIHDGKAIIGRPPERVLEILS